MLTSSRRVFSGVRFCSRLSVGRKCGRNTSQSRACWCTGPVSCRTSFQADQPSTSTSINSAAFFCGNSSDTFAPFSATIGSGQMADNIDVDTKQLHMPPAAGSRQESRVPTPGFSWPSGYFDELRTQLSTDGNYIFKDLLNRTLQCCHEHQAKNDFLSTYRVSLLLSSCDAIVDASDQERITVLDRILALLRTLNFAPRAENKNTIIELRQKYSAVGLPADKLAHHLRNSPPEQDLERLFKCTVKRHQGAINDGDFATALIDCLQRGERTQAHQLVQLLLQAPWRDHLPWQRVLLCLRLAFLQEADIAYGLLASLAPGRVREIGLDELLYVLVNSSLAWETIEQVCQKANSDKLLSNGDQPITLAFLHAFRSRQRPSCYGQWATWLQTDALHRRRLAAYLPLVAVAIRQKNKQLLLAVLNDIHVETKETISVQFWIELLDKSKIGDVISMPELIAEAETRDWPRTTIILACCRLAILKRNLREANEIIERYLFDADGTCSVLLLPSILHEAAVDRYYLLIKMPHWVPLVANMLTLQYTAKWVFAKHHIPLYNLVDDVIKIGQQMDDDKSMEDFKQLLDLLFEKKLFADGFANFRPPSMNELLERVRSSTTKNEYYRLMPVLTDSLLFRSVDGAPNINEISRQKRTPLRKLVTGKWEKKMAQMLHMIQQHVDYCGDGIPLDRSFIESYVVMAAKARNYDILTKASKVLESLDDYDMCQNESVSDALLLYYAHCGDFDSAYSLYRQMPDDTKNVNKLRLLLPLALEVGKEDEFNDMIADPRLKLSKGRKSEIVWNTIKFDCAPGGSVYQSVERLCAENKPENAEKLLARLAACGYAMGMADASMELLYQHCINRGGGIEEILRLTNFASTKLNSFTLYGPIAYCEHLVNTGQEDKLQSVFEPLSNEFGEQTATVVLLDVVLENDLPVGNLLRNFLMTRSQSANTVNMEFLATRFHNWYLQNGKVDLMLKYLSATRSVQTPSTIRNNMFQAVLRATTADPCEIWRHLSRERSPPSPLTLKLLADLYDRHSIATPFAPPSDRELAKFAAKRRIWLDGKPDENQLKMKNQPKEAIDSVFGLGYDNSDL